MKIMPELQPISIYVHIPFCIYKCRYCDFYSCIYDEHAADTYLEAVCLEWQMVKDKYALDGIPVATIYFGGGTPSILSLRQWQQINEGLVRKMTFTENCEWSIECNPESLSQEKASIWLDFGVNRISIGIQSLDDRELSILGRSHDAKTARYALHHASRFRDAGADIMYNIPGQTPGSVHATVAGILSVANIGHISAYELTVNEHTRFGRHRSVIPLPGDDAASLIEKTIRQDMASAGFVRYEVSNFAANGHRCRHNETYWKHKPYIGLGPSAHSYLPPSRFANVGSLDEYMSRLNRGELPLQFKEFIDGEKTAMEMIFLGLRTSDGIDERVFYEKTGAVFFTPERRIAMNSLIERNMLEYCPPYIRPTGKGMDFADAVALELV
jgi:oxygen-independent coproporphyrinogen III oxidase